MTSDDIVHKFDHRILYPEPPIVTLLAEIDGMRGEFKSGLHITPQVITHLKKSTIITSTGASTRIEGSKLTDEQIEKVLRGLTITKFNDRDFQEVQGYLETLQNIFEGHQTLPLRESVITSLHQHILKYSTKDELHRGDYKKKENTVGVVGPKGKVLQIMFQTTPVYLTKKEMNELVDWTNLAFEKKRFHPLLIIANFIVEFLKIHPFEDGNGRLSRILTNLLLLRTGYQFVQYVSHEQIIERRKDEYYLALRKSQETFATQHDTIVPWLNFFLSSLQQQATKAVSYLTSENVEDIFSPRQGEVWKYVSQVGEAAPGQIVQATGMALGTVRQALGSLVKMRKVKRVGRGRATRYIKIE